MYFEPEILKTYIHNNSNKPSLLYSSIALYIILFHLSLNVSFPYLAHKMQMNANVVDVFHSFNSTK